MAKQSPAQKQTVKRVMHEFKEGELEAGQGGKVRNPKQAIAIALSEAASSDRKSSSTNKRRLAETTQRERQSPPTEATKAALYTEATKRNIRGRSRMTKAQLQQALTDKR